LKLTTASYYTPNGKSIRGEGVIPDIVVEREAPQEEEKGKRQYIFDKLESKPIAKPAGSAAAPAGAANEKEKERDNQLDRAIDVIKGIRAYKKAQ
jgi:C-terminal processing protease CtpA/Prc